MVWSKMQGQFLTTFLFKVSETRLKYILKDSKKLSEKLAKKFKKKFTFLSEQFFRFFSIKDMNTLESQNPQIPITCEMLF